METSTIHQADGGGEEGIYDLQKLYETISEKIGYLYKVILNACPWIRFTRTHTDPEPAVGAQAGGEGLRVRTCTKI